MIEKVTFFSDTEELETLTGLSYNELRDAGFNLDDMNFGFRVKKEWKQDAWYSIENEPYYRQWLLDRINNDGTGYEHIKYKNWHYYMLYHS